MTFLSTILSINSLYAGVSENISSGRPGVSIESRTLGKGVLQFESGFQADETNDEGNLFLNNFIRYGINDYIELDANLNYNGLDEAESEIGDIQVGGRINFIESANGFIPQLSFQSLFQVTDSLGDSPDKLRMASILSSGHDLGELGSLTMNLNFDNFSQDSIKYSGFIVSWGRSFGRWSPFLEAYTLDSDSGAQFFWDTGFAYLLKKNLSFDLSFGTDLESDLENQFVSLGLSWRMIDL